MIDALSTAEEQFNGRKNAEVLKTKTIASLQV